MKLLINFLSVIFLLSSCTMIPKYSRPESPVAEDLSSEKSADDITPISQIKWQEFFESEDLKQIIQTSLDNNRDLKVAVLNIDAARALYRISESALLPNLEANGSLNKQKTPVNVNKTGAATTSRYDANLSSTFEFDLFGKIRSQNKAALEIFFASKEAKNAVQISLISEVANAYLQLLADREILEFSKNNFKDQDKAFVLIQNKYKAGITSKYDLAAARTTIESARSSSAFYENRVTQDKNALLLLMGVSKSELLDKKVTLDDVKLMENLATNVKSEVLLSRPDIMQAEHDLKSANANIGAARAAFFPTISLTGSLGYASTDLSNLFSSSSAAWSFSPKVTLPIFEVGRNKANLDYAKISKNIYIAQYEKAIQSAFREVSDQLSNRKSLDEQMKSQDATVKAVDDSYKISNVRYKVGIDSFVTVSVSESLMFVAQQSYINLKQQRLANLIGIYKSFGGGVN